VAKREIEVAAARPPRERQSALHQVPGFTRKTPAAMCANNMRRKPGSFS
jgi:hypothetical protein